MSAVKSSPFSSRTKSLRERFSSKRSYSENFKDPPPPSTSKQTDSAGRNVRPSMPNIGMTMSNTDNTNTTAAVVHATMMQHLQEQQQQLQKGPFQQVTVLSEHFNPFAALPEETYCSALDINSQEGDPRFPWQRDAAVQCDLSPNAEGYRYNRKDSFFMIRDAANKLQESTVSSAPTPLPPTPPNLPESSPKRTAVPTSLMHSGDSTGQTVAEKFKEVYWPNLSICNEEDEPSLQVPKFIALDGKEKKKTSMLQRALSERGRNRRLTAQMSLDETRSSGMASPAIARQVLHSPHHSWRCEQKANETAVDCIGGGGGGSNRFLPTQREMKYNSAPASRTETPPSDASPLTPPSFGYVPGTPPSRKNSRKLKFIRKQTNSAPDSFDNDDDQPQHHQQRPLTPPPPPYPQIPTIRHSSEPPTHLQLSPSSSSSSSDNHHSRTGLTVGYFNFDCMQRLMDLSMATTNKSDKPTFLLAPSGLSVGKDKAGAIMTLPSPNVQNDDEQDGPSNVFKKLSSLEDEESEQEDADHAPPPASALHRRRALVPPKMLTDGYESATDENEPHSPNGSSVTSSEGSGQNRRRRSSIVVIPPMQICPGDLLVYSKVLTQRNTLLDIDGSTQSLGNEDSSRKGKNSWSLLRLFDRSSRSKSESLCGLEEVLSSLQPSEFIDEHLSKYKGMSWAEFVSLWSGRTKQEHKSILRKNSKWLTFNSSSDAKHSHQSYMGQSMSSPPPSTNRSSYGSDSPTSASSPKNFSSFEFDKDSEDGQASPQSIFTHQNGQHRSSDISIEVQSNDNGCSSTLDEIEHQIHSIGALTRSRNEIKRREALWDLFQSESMFLYDHLMVLKNVFMEPLKKIQVEGFAMFAEPEVLFGNLDELCCVTYSFCKEFLSLILQKLSGDEIDATEVLVKLFKKSAKANALTQAYHRYTLNYINALNYLETLRRQVEFNEFEKWCSRDIRCKKLQLTDLLVSPVQHVMRVPLILKEIEMRTENLNEKKLISSIIEAEEISLRELDDKMKWLKNFERLLEIQRSIVWPSVNELDPKAFIPDFLKQPLAKQPCERLIVSPRRQIVLEGSLHLLDSGKPSETFVLLFDDMLLITRRKKGLHKKKSSITENWASSSKSSSSHESGYKYVVYKQPLSLDRFFIHDVNAQDGAANNLKNAFVLVCLNRFQQIVTVHTFQAPNDTVKNLWLSKLKDTMDRWKRTLQNTVFRNQRAATTNSSTGVPFSGIPQKPPGTTVIK